MGNSLIHVEYNEPAIVIKVIEEPIFDTERNAGSPYFREPLTMIIGALDENDNELLFFHVDKRRFQPFKETDSSLTNT